MTTPEDVRRMTSLRKQLFIALQYPVGSQQAMMDCIADHLRFMQDHEDQVFLSGPLLRDGATIGDGLTILKTDDEAEARAFMDQEPLVKAGLRRYELRRWRIQEGTMTVTISGIHGSVALS